MFIITFLAERAFVLTGKKNIFRIQKLRPKAKAYYEQKHLSFLAYPAPDPGHSKILSSALLPW